MIVAVKFDKLKCTRRPHFSGVIQAKHYWNCPIARST